VLISVIVVTHLSSSTRVTLLVTVEYKVPVNVYLLISATGLEIVQSLLFRLTVILLTIAKCPCSIRTIVTVIFAFVIIIITPTVFVKQ